MVVVSQYEVISVEGVLVGATRGFIGRHLNAGLVCPGGEHAAIEAGYKALGTSCEKELQKMWGAIPSPFR